MQDMIEDSRVELDKFQILTHMLYDTTVAYFSGAHSVSVLNSAHASFLILSDLNNFYVRNDVIEDVELFSQKIDSSLGSAFFNSKNRKGVHAKYRLTGNFLKHADRDPEKLMSICNQNAFEYLYAALSDYRSLKSRLFNAGKVDLYPEYKSTGSKKTMMGVFVSAVNFLPPWRRYPSQSPEPQIDLISQYFLHWANKVEDGVDKHFPNTRGRFRTEVDVPSLSLMDRACLAYSIFDSAGDLTLNALKSTFFNAAVKFKDARYENSLTSKEYVRGQTKGQIYDLYRKAEKFRIFVGSGYYLNVDGKVPDETKLLVDPDGFDYVDPR